MKPITRQQSVEFWKKRKADAQKKSKDVLAGRITIEKLNAKYGATKSAIVIPEKVKNAPVYILIRTSHRPEFFRRCYESVINQTYKNIVIIAHTDDPRSDYVKGDIIIKGHCYHPKTGTAPYNLYNNRLLSAIPSGYGWYHFIDDDDMYTDERVIEQLVKRSTEKAVNVARVRRGGNTIYPRTWRAQRSYQTECFFLHTALKDVARWWANKGGDHYYSRQLTNRLPINWIEGVITCKAQRGKSRGKLVDLDGSAVDLSTYYSPETPVNVMVFSNKIPEIGKPGHIVTVPYAVAHKYEKKKFCRVTFKGVEVEKGNRKQKTKDIEQALEA